MEGAIEASGGAWLVRKGGLELGGGLLDKTMRLTLGKAGLAWWQGVCGGSCGTGRCLWADDGCCAFPFLSQRWCWLRELRTRRGAAPGPLPGPPGAQITLTLTLCPGRCLGDQHSPHRSGEFCCPVDFRGCIPPKENTSLGCQLVVTGGLSGL